MENTANLLPNEQWRVGNLEMFHVEHIEALTNVPHRITAAGRRNVSRGTYIDFWEMFPVEHFHRPPQERPFIHRSSHCPPPDGRTILTRHPAYFEQVLHVEHNSTYVPGGAFA